MALIEIDGLAKKNAGSFHGYVSHNQMVVSIVKIIYKWDNPTEGGLTRKWLIDLFDLLSGMILQVLAWFGSTFFLQAQESTSNLGW